MTAKKSAAKTTKKTSSQKKQPAKTKASGKAEHPVKKEAAAFQSDEFRERMRQITSERGGFKRLAAKDFNKLSDAHKRSVLIKRAYHAARKEGVANPYEHARAVVEKQLATQSKPSA